MAESTGSNSSLSLKPTVRNSIRKILLWPIGFLLSMLAPVVATMLLYHLESFQLVSYPARELTHQTVSVPRRNTRMLHGSERIGVGQLLGPEDIAYDKKSQVMYTGCADGWIKQVTVNNSAADSVVESWVNTGGRPLGLVFAHRGDHLIVADADRGLLKVTKGGSVKLLTDQAKGRKFKLTDGVDVADNGMIYFTDASFKYSFNEFMLDILEGKPHGRLMSYNPKTRKTKVLVRNLYFANGVVVSPDQNLVIFCETPLRRCKRLYIKGERKGSVDMFIKDLPGQPDNIRYDGADHYWIGLSVDFSYASYLAQRHPFSRKIMGVMEKYLRYDPGVEKNGGVLTVDLEGNPTAHYYDLELSLVSSGIKIGDHLYCGSIIYPYIIRLELNQHPAVAGK